MSTLLSFAIAPTRAWTALYTRGLPSDVRGERREEIDCDLWEHQRLAEFQRDPATRTAAAILLRLIMGVPADMTWRLEAGASARSGKGTQMNESRMLRGFFFAALAVAIVPAAMGVAAIFGATWGSTAERVIWGSLLVASSVSIVAGLLLCTRKPHLGIGLVALGAVGIGVAWFFIPFITVPLGAAMVFLAYRRARRTGWRLRGGDLPNATA